MATKTIFGTIAADGSIISGQGFIVTKQETGIYLIDFEPGFADVPAIVGSQTGFGNLGQSTLDSVVFPFLNRGAATAKVGNNGGGATNLQFSFIAVGEE